MREFLNIIVIDSIQERKQTLKEEIARHKRKVDCTEINKKNSEERIFKKNEDDIDIIVSRKDDNLTN